MSEMISEARELSVPPSQEWDLSSLFTEVFAGHGLLSSTELSISFAEVSPDQCGSTLGCYHSMVTMH